MRSRPPYEQIEVLAASVEQTDSDIDAHPYSFEGGESDPEFINVHCEDAIGGAPYSSIGASVRGEIVRASYQLRDQLQVAAESLRLVQGRWFPRL